MSDENALLTALQNMEARLSGRLDKLDGRMDKLDGRMDRQESILAQFRINLVEELGRTRADLMERIDRLQVALVRQQEGDIVNLGIAERAERIAKSASDEARSLAEQVSNLTRQIKRLQSDVQELRGGL